MTDHTIRTEKPHYCKIGVHHGEDWYDALPRLVDPTTIDPDDPSSGTPFDTTGMHFSLFIRPALDHLTRFVVISDEPPSGVDRRIIHEDDEQGLIAIFMPREDVEELLPISQTAGWRQFLLITFDDPDLGVVQKLLWKGPLLVFPARVAATV